MLQKFFSFPSFEEGFVIWDNWIPESDSKYFRGNLTFTEGGENISI